MPSNRVESPEHISGANKSSHAASSTRKDSSFTSPLRRRGGEKRDRELLRSGSKSPKTWLKQKMSSPTIRSSRRSSNTPSYLDSGASLSVRPQSDRQHRSRASLLNSSNSLRASSDDVVTHTKVSDTLIPPSPPGVVSRGSPSPPTGLTVSGPLSARKTVGSGSKAAAKSKETNRGSCLGGAREQGEGVSARRRIAFEADPQASVFLCCVVGDESVCTSYEKLPFKKFSLLSFYVSLIILYSL